MNCLLVIIGILLLVIGIVILTKCDEKKSYFVFGHIFVIVSVMIIFVSGMIAALRDNYDTFNRKYIVTKYMIETYSANNDENLDILYNILNRARTINSDIISNKKYCNNVFIGFMYNKNVGEFELIDIDWEKLKKQ